MKKFSLAAIMVSALFLSSCGVSSSYYASSEFEDGIYYRPSADDSRELAAAMKELDGLVERTRREAARFTDTIVVSEAVSSVNLDYRPDTRYAVMLDGDSTTGVQQLDITFNFDDFYGYRNYNYWDYWYMANNRPWMAYGYNPWYGYWGGPWQGWGYPWYGYGGPMFGIGFVWDPWWDWGWGGYYAWGYPYGYWGYGYPWYGPWGYPWYDSWGHPWYGGWWPDMMAEAQRRQDAHNGATAKKVADIRAGGGGRQLASAGSIRNTDISSGRGSNLTVTDIRGNRTILGEKYIKREVGTVRGSGTVTAFPSKGTFRRSTYVNANMTTDDVRNSYYNRFDNNSSYNYNGNTVSGYQYNGRTATSGRNTGSYGNARSSYHGTISTSGSSVRSSGGNSSGSVRSSGGGGGTRRR